MEGSEASTAALAVTAWVWSSTLFSLCRLFVFAFALELNPVGVACFPHVFLNGWFGRFDVVLVLSVDCPIALREVFPKLLGKRFRRYRELGLAVGAGSVRVNAEHFEPHAFGFAGLHHEFRYGCTGDLAVGHFQDWAGGAQALWCRFWFAGRNKVQSVGFERVVFLADVFDVDHHLPIGIAIIGDEPDLQMFTALARGRRNRHETVGVGGLAGANRKDERCEQRQMFEVCGHPWVNGCWLGSICGGPLLRQGLSKFLL